MYHGLIPKQNSPHKVGVLTVIRKSDYVLVKTECPMEDVVVAVVVVVSVVDVVVFGVVRKRHTCCLQMEQAD